LFQRPSGRGDFGSNGKNAKFKIMGRQVSGFAKEISAILSAEALD